MCVCINEEMFVFKLNLNFIARYYVFFIFILRNIYIYIIAENYNFHHIYGKIL